MSLTLPATVDAYFAANKQLDVDGMMKHFAPDAVLIDNGTRHEGVGAIRKLLTEAVGEKAIFYPDLSREENGKIVLAGPTEGTFPGSPLRFTYCITMADDAIKVLETDVWA